MDGLLCSLVNASSGWSLSCDSLCELMFYYIYLTKCKTVTCCQFNQLVKICTLIDRFLYRHHSCNSVTKHVAQWSGLMDFYEFFDTGKMKQSKWGRCWTTCQNKRPFCTVICYWLFHWWQMTCFWWTYHNLIFKKC